MNLIFNPVINLLRNEQLLLNTVLAGIGCYVITFFSCAVFMIAANYGYIDFTVIEVRSFVIPAFMIASVFLMFLFCTILYGIRKGEL